MGGDEEQAEREREREEEVCSQTHCCANINHVDSHKIIRADHSQSGSLPPRRLSTDGKK